MNPTKLHESNKILFVQRNSLLIIAALLLSCNLCLAVFIVSKTEKTILVPATLSKSVVLEGEVFSEGYLEEMTLFFSDLLLNLTPKNIAYKSSVLLRHAHPSNYQELKEYFKHEEARFKEYNLVTQFDLSSIKINNMKAEVQGLLHSKFGLASESNQNSIFEIEYTHSSGGLQIKSFKRKEGGSVQSRYNILHHF